MIMTIHRFFLLTLAPRSLARLSCLCLVGRCRVPLFFHSKESRALETRLPVDSTRPLSAETGLSLRRQACKDE